MGTHSLLGFLLLITLISLTNAGFVKKILRHKRQTLSPPSEHNVTFPSADHPVVFSHVYNINVPESSLCSVDLESPEGAHVHSKDIAAVPQGHHVTEHTFNGENQILFTHRINIPRQACGCKDDFPGLKELMSRLEMLEGEVSALRDQCSSEQLTGELGTKPYCNGHGKYSTETCACICDPGWRGPNCTEGECPTSCQDRGRCVDGKCECYKGFTGEDCALKTCPMDCGAHGICEREVCVCSDGFFGEDCSESRCLNNCLGRGRCDEGDCICDEPWTGLDCSELICPNDCYDRGRCVNGTCYCDEGFSGEDCADFSCPNNCRGNGFCVDGKCICTVGYSGQDCSQLTCLNDCNDRGRCFNGVCICDSGYQGEDCSQVACVNNCHNRGQCINGRCSCDAGFHGDDCSELSCPNNCQLKGRCVNGQCVCDEGFAGEDCSIHTCPSNCYGRGECIEGRCACHVGYVGEDCSQLSCPNNCNNRGRCIDGQCVCDEGFSGEDCSQKACLNDCLARGYCIDGKCFCHEGYTGESCSILACPENCNNRGRCVNGRCTCDSGYEGESCADLSCINNCQDKGRCVNGQCFCDEGYIGEDCSEVSPPKDLTVGEVSTETVDLSWNNEMLVTEYLITYVPTSPGGLLMEFTVPGDKNAATVKELEPGIEYLISVYAVLSNKRSIPVSARVATDLPQPEGVRFKSVRETSVEVVWDQLDISFDSWEIYFRNTKEENGKVVSTLPPSQNEFLQSGLGPGQEYEVSINVVKNNTRGPQTSRTVTTKIDGPRQVEVKDVTDSSALISWYLPVAPADGVTIFYMPSSNHSDETTVDVSPSDKQYSIDNLKPDTEYAVSIISRHKEATSDPVTTIFTTELDAPTAAQAVSQTDDSITLEWTNSQADVSSYRVKYTPISGSSHGERVFPRGSGRTTQATITGLKPGTEYGVGVTAVKHERESLPATTNAATELDPPRDFKQIRSTETSLSVSWQKPQAKLSGYRLEYMSRDGQAEQVDIPASANTFVLSDLIPGMSYTMTLTAERGHKRSRPVSLTASTATLTFYLAASDDHEIRTPPGSEDIVSSSVILDTPESQIFETEPEDKHGKLTISAVASDGFDLASKLKIHRANDDVAAKYKDTQKWLDGREVQFPADSDGARISVLKPYQTELFEIKSSQASSIHEAVAGTAPPDVLALSIKEAPTTAISAQDEENHKHGYDISSEAPSDNEEMISGAEPESSGMELLSNLTPVNVTATSMSLVWSAPDEAFDSFLVELVAPSAAAAQPRVTTIPGGLRKAKIEGLLPSTLYEITLHGLMEGTPSLPLRVFTTTAGLEPTLGNLIISDITWDSFVASWNPTGEDFNSFVIEVTNMDDLAEAQNLTLSGDATSLLISGLNPNTSYMVGLYGTHQGSFLEPLYSEATTVIQPVVGKLFASNFTPESFTIHWNNTEKLFDGFVLEIIDSDWLMELMEYNISRNVTSKDVTGLRPSTDYIAYLYGTYKGSRTGAVSTVASTAEEPDLSKLVVSNITSDRFSLSWRTGEKEFDTFIVEVRESALPSQAMGRTLPGDARSTVMAGLRANTSYNIKLYASEGGRQSTQPLLAVATTEEVPLLGPIFASSANPHYLSLHWNTLSGSFDGFVLQVSDSEQQSDTLEFRLPGEARNFTIPNLMDDTGYDIELYGISHGRRTPSVYVHALTAPLPKVENLTISNVTPYGFRVSWEVKQHPLHQEDISPSGGGFSHFHIVVTDSGWLLEPQEFTVPGDQSHLDIWGLITGIGYEVKLTGVSESGLLSRPLTTVAVTEAEPEVEHLFISDITSHSFRLSWAADEDQFDRFVIKIRDSKRLAHPREYKARGSERTKVITGLMSGTEYEIELYGLTLDQRSQPITAVAQTGLSAPKGLHFTEVTDSSAVVHWSNPRSQVDSYRITYVPFEGGSPLILNADGSMSEMLLINMFPGKTYQVTVSSLKGLEESEPSTGTVTTALDSPRGVTAVNVTDTSALLSWQPSVATVDGYVITYSTDTVSPVVEHVSGNIVEFQINTLVPGSHYTAAVYGVKEAQRSESTLTAFTTDLDPPRDLMANNVQTDTATLTWKPPTAAVTGYMLSFSSPGGVIREVMLSPTASSYSMSQLTGSTKYDVRLQAISGAQRSRYVTTTFSTNKVGQLYARPWDCAQILLNGETTSGLYTIYIGGEESQPIQVYCDMTTDGGGWMVFLRRQNGKLEFFRNWKNYTAGFGNMNDEFWLGLSSLHKITSLGHYELRVDLRDNEESAYAQYDKFTIAEPRTRYKVYLGAYSGTAGDSMSYHQGRPFSTYDNDNDIAVTNCALSYKGAFWYKNCHRVNLMGKYGDSSHSKGINWFHWKGHEHSIEFAEMKIRPANFKNPESRKKSS
ncbi:PREDICTED: tenascin-like isoform X1 [Cyprinodon variegatus]|uniref:tenascin-like isoform X1 n=1 Tax=Cyprinodon variegatus TaxID=28743 RepID=UPI00074255E4|nr:PREDICTED: tenascin-like isoform X1 [Cyprinodon variegatus]